MEAGKERETKGTRMVTKSPPVPTAQVCILTRIMLSCFMDLCLLVDGDRLVDSDYV